ncbi:unnamed protein product [Cercospora beticola]|nr:unnamed protein product [Cercospora beticola]
MSTYDDDYYEPRRYRNVRTRPRDRDEPDYVREETYIERGKGPGPRGTEMVYRGRDDSIEDIPRDFPPASRYDDGYGPPLRARSVGGRGRRYSDDYDDDRFTERGAPVAAGVAAGYAAGRHEERRRKHRDDRGYDSDYSRSPPRKPERRKSGLEDALGAVGLGGLAANIMGNKDKDRDRSPSGRSTRSRSRARSRRGYSSSRSRSRSRSRAGGDKSRTERKWAQAAQAALVAGAVEAFRSRREAGPWTGEKGRRVATAALGAGGIDGLIDRDPDKKSKRHLAEAVIGGLAANRLANGPRSKSRGRGADSRDVSPEAPRGIRARSRSIVDRLRGRSQSRGRAPSEDGNGVGLGKKLLGAGAVAGAGKYIYDQVRSKSRKRRSPSRDSSADSYVPSRHRARDQRRSQGSDTGSTRRTDDRDDQGGREVARGTRSGALAPAAAGGAAGAMAKSNGDAKNDGGNDSSDSSSTTDMEKTRKHMRGKELITAGLATVATIHAAHGVYSSMEAHEKRHRLVAEGEMSPEEARKKQTKAWIQDAAAVGIAALGIKGAFSEWKEMNEQRREIQEIEKRKAARRKKRAARQKQEEMERHERMMNILEKNPQLAIGHQMQQNGYFPNTMGGAAPTPDQSGNPYASAQRY